MQSIKNLPFPQNVIRSAMLALSVLSLLAAGACGGGAQPPAPAEPPQAESPAQESAAQESAAQEAPLEAPPAEETAEDAQAMPQDGDDQPAEPADEQTPPPAAEPLPAVDEAELKGVTINLWHTFGNEQIKPMLEEFNRSNPWGITVQDWYQENSARLSINIRRAIVENDLPHVALGYVDQAALWDMEGGVADLTPYVDDAQWGLTSEEQQDYLPVFWEYGQVGNKRLGVPALASGTFLLYNQSWAEEMGYNSPPDSLDNFKAQACAANEYQRKDTIPQNDYTGGWLINTDPAVILAWLRAYGAEITKPVNDNPYDDAYQFESEPAEQLFAYLKNLVDNNCVWTSNETYADEEFVQRKALFASGGTIDLSFQTLAFTEAVSADEWTLLPFPGRDGEPVVGVQVPSLVMLKSEAKTQLAAWLFMKWLTTPTAQSQWAALTGYFPVRTSSADLMKDYASSHPQWAAGRDLLQYARTEPTLPSWGDARWVMGDAGVQLFRPYFTSDRIKPTLHELDRTVAEIRDMVH